MRSNCIVFAVALYCIRCLGYVREKPRREGAPPPKPWVKREGYMLFRRSRWGPFCHVLYAERRKSGALRIVSYVPNSPRMKPVPPAIFEGRSKWGDL